ncbi:MAG: AI-2E family transporter, partial [Methylococcus sp.]
MNRRLPLLLFLALLAFLVYRIVGNLLEPVIWAVILAYASWPLYARVRALCRGGAGLAATVMVLLLGIAVMLPLVGLMLVIQRE